MWRTAKERIHEHTKTTVRAWFHVPGDLKILRMPEYISSGVCAKSLDAVAIGLAWKLFPLGFCILTEGLDRRGSNGFG